MNITFLGQGYEPESKNSVGNHLLNILSQKGFHTFTGVSAFASEAGVIGLADNIEAAKNNFKKLNLIVGIDEEGTSKEALYEINNLKINSYIFYQTESPIFHPKIYLFEGEKETKLILGSSNLTARGLFGNVESSLLIEFSNKDKEGMQLLSELKEYYSGLFNFKDPNLFKISKSTIQDFIDRGIVPNETNRNRKHGKQPTVGKINDSTSGLKIPKRATAKIPSSFKGKPKTSKQVAKIIKELEISGDNKILPNNLIWRKMKLPQSDAQRVPFGTAITATVALSQARFKVNGVTIDQKTYFRNQVFNNLNWNKTKPKSNSYEEVNCEFDVTILGKHLGVFNLKISHDPVRIAGQGNTPTWLHWGDVLVEYLRKKTNVMGKTLNLYSPSADSKLFSIVIE